MSENGSTPRPAGNGFDPEKTRSFGDRLMNLHGDIDKQKSAHMLKCKAIREDMNSVYDEAKDAGIPKKEMKAAIKTRLMLAKVEAIRDDLEGESQDTYDMIRHALGDLADLPLGEHAAGQAPDAPGTPAAEAAPAFAG